MKTCRFAVLTLLGVLIALTCLPLSAQEIRDLKEGDRVRVTLLTYGLAKIEGRFHGFEQDTLLVFLSESNEVAQIPRDQVRDFRVHRGSGRHPWKGLGIGFGSGALLGAVVGLSEGDDWLFSAEAKAAMGATWIGLIGGVTGLVIGSFITTEHWEQISLPDVRPSVQVGYDGRFGVAFSIPLKR